MGAFVSHLIEASAELPLSMEVNGKIQIFLLMSWSL